MPRGRHRARSGGHRCAICREVVARSRLDHFHGISMDLEVCLWVALFFFGSVRRYAVSVAARRGRNARTFFRWLSALYPRRFNIDHLCRLNLDQGLIRAILSSIACAGCAPRLRKKIQDAVATGNGTGGERDAAPGHCRRRYASVRRLQWYGHHRPICDNSQGAADIAKRPGLIRGTLADHLSGAEAVVEAA